MIGPIRCILFTLFWYLLSLLLTATYFNYRAQHGRIRLNVSGTSCEIQGSTATVKDGGIWNFQVGAGRDEFYHEKNFQYLVTIKGKQNIFQIFFRATLYILNTLKPLFVTFLLRSGIWDNYYG